MDVYKNTHGFAIWTHFSSCLHNSRNFIMLLTYIMKMFVIKSKSSTSMKNSNLLIYNRSKAIYGTSFCERQKMSFLTINFQCKTNYLQFEHHAHPTYCTNLGIYMNFSSKSWAPHYRDVVVHIVSLLYWNKFLVKT